VFARLLILDEGRRCRFRLAGGGAQELHLQLGLLELFQIQRRVAAFLRAGQRLPAGVEEIAIDDDLVVRQLAGRGREETLEYKLE